MSEHRTLADELRRGARELARQEPPPAVWSAVRAAHRRAHRQRFGWMAWSGAAACAAVLAGSVLLLLMPATPRDVSSITASGFVPLVPADRWPDAPAQAWLVSTELPRERLAAFGLPFDPARAGDSVRAELLLQPSGEVLAVRLFRRP